MTDYLEKRLGLFVRNITADVQLESFFVAAITTILAVRAYLDVLDYPTIGGTRFHIAHMLWGGVLLTCALFITLAYLNKEARHSAAIIGGIGFGLFIDELGKFITRDNNYFYQPTIALIYVVFIVIFFGIRAFQNAAGYSSQEYAANALEAAKDIVIHDLDEHEKAQALEFISRADHRNPVVAAFTPLLADAVPQPNVRAGVLTIIRRALRALYLALVRSSWFAHTLVAVFAVLSLVNLTRSLGRYHPEFSFAEWGQFVSAIASGILILGGIFFLHRGNRLGAYEFFRRAVLVSILFTQFFRFIEEQLSAITGLIVSVTMLIACQYLIDQEKALARSEPQK